MHIHVSKLRSSKIFTVRHLYFFGCFEAMLFTWRDFLPPGYPLYEVTSSSMTHSCSSSLLPYGVCDWTLKWASIVFIANYARTVEPPDTLYNGQLKEAVLLPSWLRVVHGRVKDGLSILFEAVPCSDNRNTSPDFHLVLLVPQTLQKKEVPENLAHSCKTSPKVWRKACFKCRFLIWRGMGFGNRLVLDKDQQLMHANIPCLPHIQRCLHWYDRLWIKVMNIDCVEF